MPFRLVGHAENRIDALLLDSAKRWGIPAAARYHRLILAAAAIAGEDPGFARGAAPCRGQNPPSPLCARACAS